VPSVLFYSPFAGIPEHELPEQALQNEFRRKGWSVKVIRCDGYLKNLCQQWLHADYNQIPAAYLKSLFVGTAELFATD
jgi:hypothetical protein